MSKTSTQKLVSDLKGFMDDAEGLVTATATQTGDRVAEWRDRVGRAAAEIKPRLSSAEAFLESKAKETASRADTYVRANPWAVIGLAAGIALVVGVLAARRRDY